MCGITPSWAVGRGYGRPERVRRILDEHVRGTRGWHCRIDNLLVPGVWHRRFPDSQ